MTNNKPQMQEADRSQTMVNVKKQTNKKIPTGRHIIF